jgi:hypothetical protein
MLFDPAGSVEVSFCGLAKPEYVGDIKPRKRVMLIHNKPKYFIFCLTFCIPYNDNILDISMVNWLLNLEKRKDRAMKRSDTDDFWIKIESLQWVLFVIFAIKNGNMVII